MNKEQRKEYMRSWQLAHPEKIAQYREKHRTKFGWTSLRKSQLGKEI